MAQGRFFGIAFFVALLFAIAPIPAALANAPTSAVLATPPQPTWQQLSAEQREILAPLRRDWDEMENFRRKKWLGIAGRYPQMKVEEQQRMQERMREWVRMPPEQRRQVRDSYKEFQQLPASQKQAVKQKWDAYSNLSEEDKIRLKEGKRPLPKPTADIPELFIPPAAETSTSTLPANTTPGKP